jgi:hypothetical protein
MNGYLGGGERVIDSLRYCPVSAFGDPKKQLRKYVMRIGDLWTTLSRLC